MVCGEINRGGILYSQEGWNQMITGIVFTLPYARQLVS